MSFADELNQWKSTQTPTSRFGSPYARNNPDKVKVGNEKYSQPGQWDFNKVMTAPSAMLADIFTPSTPQAEDLPYWERVLTEYEAWDSPWGAKFALETLPWLLVPSAGGVAAKAAGLAAKGGAIGKVGKALEFAAKPFATGEKVVSDIVSAALKPIGKGAKNVLNSISGRPTTKLDFTTGEIVLPTKAEIFSNADNTLLNRIAFRLKNSPVMPVIKSLGGLKAVVNTASDKMEDIGIRELYAREVLRSDADNIVAFIYPEVQKYGSPIKLLQLDSKGVVNVTKEKGTLGDVLEDLGRETNLFTWTDDVAKEYAQTLVNKVKQIIELAKKEGVDIPEEFVWHRMVKGKFMPDGEYIKSDLGSYFETERTYKLSQADGVKAGIDYEWNPNYALESTIRHYINKVADKRFINAIKQYEVKGKAIPSVEEYMGKSYLFKKPKFSERVQKEWSVDKKTDLKTAKDELIKLEKQKEAGDTSQELFDKISELREIVSRGKTKGLKDTDLISSVMEEPLEFIKFTERNMIFPKGLAEAIDKHLGDVGQDWLRKAGSASGAMRLTQAALDFSAAFIQGLPVLGRNPKAWAKAVTNSFRFLKGGEWEKYMLSPETRAISAERMHYGGTVAFAEPYEAMGGVRRGIKKFSEAINSPELGSKAGKALELSYGKAEAVFTGFGEVARNELWKSLKRPNMNENQLRDLAAVVDKMTGVMNTKAMMLGTTQREFENAFMFFAPRYTRASLGLVADIFKGGLTGNEARKALGGLMAGGAAVYTGTALALGQEPDFDPTSSNFMTVEIDGDRYGVGGTLTALMRLAGGVAMALKEDPSQLINPFTDYGSLNRWDNPFIKFLYSRTSTLSSLLNSVIVEKADYFGRPIESGVEWGRFILDKATPIAMQRFTHADEEKISPLNITAELSGLRTWRERKIRTYKQYKQQEYNTIEETIWANYPREYREISDKVNKLNNEGKKSEANLLMRQYPSVVYAMKQIALRKKQWLMRNPEENFNAIQANQTSG